MLSWDLINCDADFGGIGGRFGSKLYRCLSSSFFLICREPDELVK